MLGQYLSLPRAVHILCLGTFINRAGTFLIPFLTLYLCKKLNYDQTFATLTMGAYGLGSLCAALIGGYLADRIGRRVIMLTGLFGGAAILSVFGSLESKPAIVAAVMSLALIGEVYRPAASAMIADLTQPHERPLAFGLLYVSINLGFAVAPVVGGLVAKYSYHLLFWGDAITCATYGFIILRTIPETLGAVTSTQPDQSPTSAPRDRASVGEVLRCILSDRPFLIFCLACHFVGITYMQGMGTLPLYLVNSLHFDERDYGMIIAVNGFMIAIFQLPLTTVLNRFNRSNIMVASAVVSGIGFSLTAFASTGWQFVFTVVIWTIGEMMQSPFMSTIVADMAPPRHRASYMGALSVTFSSAMSVGVPLGGFALVKFGRGIWGMTLVISLIAAALYACIRRQMAPRPRTVLPD